jgi:hypothetical protein
MTKPSTPTGRSVRSHSPSARRSSRLARTSMRRVRTGGILGGSGCLSSCSTAAFQPAPSGNWVNPNAAEQQSSRTPGQTSARQPSPSADPRNLIGAGRSRDSLLWPLAAPRELLATALMVGLVDSRPPSEDGRHPRSPVSRYASAAAEPRGDVVQRRDEADLLLAGERGGRRVGGARPLPLDHSGRGVGGELVPGCAEHLQCLLQTGEGLGRRRIAASLFSGRMEGPRCLDQLRRAVVEMICCVHARDRGHPVRSRPWGSMPK